MKSKIRKIALFGTSADPPTSGHKKIIQELSKKYKLVICYASDNPSKNHKENLFFRSLLLEKLICDFDHPHIIFDQNLSSPWALTSIKRCKRKYTHDQIDFIIGSDLVSEMFTWKNINQIIGEVKLIIIPREGYPIEQKYLLRIKESNADFEVLDIKIPKISSSMIRKNSEYSGLPKSLMSIVKNNNLYDFKS